jgi:hypothetical protein
MIYEVYGKYVKGLDEDRFLILDYLGTDYLKNSNDMTTDSQAIGESLSEGQRSMPTNYQY